MLHTTAEPHLETVGNSCYLRGILGVLVGLALLALPLQAQETEEICMQVGDRAEICFDARVVLPDEGTERIEELEARIGSLLAEAEIDSVLIETLYARIDSLSSVVDSLLAVGPDPDPDPTEPPVLVPGEFAFEFDTHLHADDAWIHASWTHVEGAQWYTYWGAGIGPEDDDRIIDQREVEFRAHPDAWFCVRAWNAAGPSEAWRCDNYRDLVAGQPGVPHTVTLSFVCPEESPDCIIECPEAVHGWATPSACECIQSGRCDP